MSSNFRLDLYERKERLGSGAFGTVFRYELKEDCSAEGDHNHPREIAIKEVDLDEAFYKDIDYELELRVLRALSAGGGHRNVVSLEAEMEIVPVKVVGMAMRVSQGDLKMLLARSDFNVNLSTKLFAVIKLLRQIVTGLCFVHGMGIVHRDVKPANILVSCSTNLKGESFDHKTLLNKDVTLQIADFGLSRFLVDEEDLPQLRAAAAAAAAAATACRPRSLAAAPVGDLDSDVSLTHGIGTRRYMAPEVFPPVVRQKREEDGDEGEDPDDGEGEDEMDDIPEAPRYDFGADLWSLGVVADEIISGSQTWGRDLGEGFSRFAGLRAPREERCTARELLIRLDDPRWRRAALKHLFASLGVGREFRAASDRFGWPGNTKGAGAGGGGDKKKD